jgi:hypothetical protein
MLISSRKSFICSGEKCCWISFFTATWEEHSHGEPVARDIHLNHWQTLCSRERYLCASEGALVYHTEATSRDFPGFSAHTRPSVMTAPSNITYVSIKGRVD